MQQMQGMNVGIDLEQTLHFFAFLCILRSAAGSVLGLGVLRILRHS